MKVAYCRVSTEKESQISSIENQIRYFTQLGIEPQNIYADEGISGTKIRKRPQLNKLLYDCGIDIEQHGGDELDIIYKQSNRPTEITDIYIKDISRFARNRDADRLIQRLTKMNITVHFMDINKTNFDPDFNVTFSILLTMAANYSEELSRKVKQGKTLKLQKKYGLIIKDNNYYIDKEKEEIIRLIFSLNKKGWSSRSISNAIEESFGEPFNNKKVLRILNNNIYREVYGIC